LYTNTIIVFVDSDHNSGHVIGAMVEMAHQFSNHYGKTPSYDIAASSTA
jgi:hypothetical protein